MVETKKNKGFVIVSIKESDRLNAAVADEIKSELNEIVSKNSANTILNLSNIKFIDSTGIGVLISALKTARQNNNSFSLCALQKDVMSLLTLMKLDKVFDICADDSVL